ncbi:MAG: hypothetical protein WCG81_07505, partial [Candidatus Angelobacter sp.]
AGITQSPVMLKNLCNTEEYSKRRFSFQFGDLALPAFRQSSALTSNLSSSAYSFPLRFKGFALPAIFGTFGISGNGVIRVHPRRSAVKGFSMTAIRSLRP